MKAIIKWVDAWGNQDYGYEWNDTRTITEKDASAGFTAGEAIAWFRQVFQLDNETGADWRDEAGRNVGPDDCGWEILELCDTRTSRPLYAIVLEEV